MTTWTFNGLDFIAIDGVEVTCGERQGDQYVFVPVKGGRPLQFSGPELTQLMASSRWTYRHLEHLPAALGKGKTVATHSLRDADPKAANMARCKAHIVAVFLQLEKEKVVNRSSVQWDRTRQLIEDRLDLSIVGSVLHGSRRTKKTEGFVLPKRSTLLAWIDAYLKDGASGLLDGKGGNRRSRLTPEVNRQMAIHAGKYASPERPSGKALYDDFTKALEQKEKALGITLKPPSYSRFMLEIAQLSVFQKVFGREGPLAAAKKFRMSNGGEPFTSILDCVEIDTWEVDVVSLTPDELALFAPWVKDAPPKQRLFLSAAIDVVSTVVLGLRFSLASSTEATFDCLRMVLRDKSFLRERYGCTTPFNQFGRPRLIRMDGGAEFSGEVWKALGDLKITVENPPARMPWMRATIEELFRQFSETASGLLVGRTFHRGAPSSDEDPATRAALTHEELAKAFTVYIIDIYHALARDDLGGDTPVGVWEKQLEAGSWLPPPDMTAQRGALGQTFIRKADHRGIVIDNCWFNSVELNQRLQKSEPEEFTVRLDPWNMGLVSVKIGKNDWLSVPALDEDAEGLSRAEWLIKQKQISQQTKLRNEGTKSTRSHANASIKSIVERAAAAQSIGLGPPTEQAVARASAQTGIAAKRHSKSSGSEPPMTFRPHGPHPMSGGADHVSARIPEKQQWTIRGPKK
jgi:putative transposase